MCHWLLYIIIPSLLIAEPDDRHFYSTYGHAAIRMQCPELETDFVYDYVGEHLTNRFGAYLAGNLKMGLEVLPTEDYLRRDGGTVHEYALQLPDTMLFALCQVLDDEYRRGYVRAYNPVTGSCCQMVVRYLDKAAKMANESIAYTYTDEYELSIRELSHLHSKDCPWTDVLYNTLGDIELSDRSLPKRQKVLYPAQLVPFLQSATIDARPLLSATDTLVQQVESVPSRRTLHPNVVALLFLLLTLFSFSAAVYTPSAKRSIRHTLSSFSAAVYTLFFTLLGLLEWLLWLVSDLPFTGFNLLAIAFTPWMAIFWRYRRYWGVPYVVVLIGLLVYTLLSPCMVMASYYQLLLAAEIVFLISCLIAYLPPIKKRPMRTLF